MALPYFSNSDRAYDRSRSIYRVFGIGLWVAVLGLFLGQAQARTKGESSKDKGPAKIAVLDLIEFSDNSPKPEIGNLLRSVLPPSHWQVVSRDSTVKKMREYGQNPDMACNTTQCAFDVGNILQVEYVLFGSCTIFGKVDAITLKLMHIPTAQIVWVKAVESPSALGLAREQNLKSAFSREVGELNPGKLDLSKPESKKNLAVIDLSDNPQTAKVFFERVCTRIYGVRHYDLMAPSELAELLTALEINKYSVVPSLENMVGLGQKLGVGYLLYSRLYRDGKSHVYRLAFYDITERKLVLELPPQPSEEDSKLLEYERVFFNTLAERDKRETKPVASVGATKSHSKALWISLGILGVGGGLAALWVESLSKGSGEGGPMNNADIFGLPRNPPPETDQ
jgi:hypothetical protein